MRNEQHPGDWVLETFTRGGVDNRTLEQMEPEAIKQVLLYPDLIVPADVNRLLIACAQLTDNPDFGLEMVKLVDISMFGTYSYLLENAGTVDEFCNIAQHYYPMFYQGARIEYRNDGKHLRLRFCVDDSEGVCSRHDNEWTLGFFASFLRRKLGGICIPVETSFNSTQPKQLERQYQVFGENLRFKQPVTELVYSASITEMTLNYADPALLLILREHADKLLNQVGEQNSFSNNVKLLINDELEKGDVRAMGIASKLSLSLSSMKRKLADENTNFRQLRQEVVAELARKLLTDSSTSIGDIAMRLGYSDQSAFCRVFSRQHGISPNRYRAKNSH